MRDALTVALLDEAEVLGEQGIVLEPEVVHEVCRQPSHAHQREHQVRQDRLPADVMPVAELEAKGR